MKTAAAILLLLGLATSRLHAQQVSAVLSIREAPVSARVILSDGYRHSYLPPAGYQPRLILYPRPIRRAVVVQYPARVVVVERFHRPRGHARGYRAHRGYRSITVYHDPRCDRYYDRLDDRYSGLRPVEVWERDGRYYRGDEDRAD